MRSVCARAMQLQLHVWPCGATRCGGTHPHSLDSLACGVRQCAANRVTREQQDARGACCMVFLTIELNTLEEGAMLVPIACESW